MIESYKDLFIEDYALVGDTHTCALISKYGSVDWYCLPRFDSPSVFSRLIGEESNGYWSIRPADRNFEVNRQYLENSMVLKTTFRTPSGSAELIDFMPVRDRHARMIRILRGITGSIDMTMELVVRFDYGKTVPWATKRHGGVHFIAGPNTLCLFANVETQGREMKTISHFRISEGNEIPFQIVYSEIGERLPVPIDAHFSLTETLEYWRRWIKASNYDGPYKKEVSRSLMVLKCLTYEPSGGIVAAPTTSLPESLGGERNWDYRYCWLRDASLTLNALISAGFNSEAFSWMHWLVRAVAGDPAQLQIMYGPCGERRLDEYEVPWLKGYWDSKPVRIGNEASNQLQLDVYGEVIATVDQALDHGIPVTQSIWNLELKLLDHLAKIWDQPDDGIWEVRGGRQHFTHSKIMAWVAFDRAINTAKRLGQLDAVSGFEKTKALIEKDILEKGWSDSKKAFVQFYGSDLLDASILLAANYGFLPPDDPRLVSTIEAISRELRSGPFVNRYQTDKSTNNVDGLSGREGSFLACSFWLVDALSIIGRKDEAESLFAEVIQVKNDLDLISEEYDAEEKRQLGNFPQALSHMSLINSAFRLYGKKLYGKTVDTLGLITSNMREQTDIWSAKSEEFDRLKKAT